MTHSRLLARPALIGALVLALLVGGLAAGSRAGSVAAQGTLVFEDDFSKKDSGWLEYSDEDATRQYNGGEYVITVKRSDISYAAFGQHNLSIRDFDLTVKFRFITPSDVANGYAMFVWRYGASSTTTVYYSLFLDPYSAPNQCSFDRFNSGQRINLLQIPCDGIMKTASSDWNVLHVIARGSDMTFLINDVKIVDLRDRFLREGVLGLGAVNRTNPTGMKVAWDDIKVYSPERAPTWTNTPRPTPTEEPEMPTEEPTSTTIPSPTPRPTNPPTDTPTAVRPTRTPGPTDTPSVGGKAYLPSLMRAYSSDGSARLSGAPPRRDGAYSLRSAMYAATLSGSW